MTRFIEPDVVIRFLVRQQNGHTYVIAYHPGEESKVFRYLWDKRHELGLHGFAEAAYRVQEAIDG